MAPVIRDLRTLKFSRKLQLKSSVTPGHKSDKHVNMTSYFNTRRRLTTQDPIQISSLKTISSKLGFQNENNFTNSRLRGLYSLIQSHVAAKHSNKFINP